jgi:hypothetical protein
MDTRSRPQPRINPFSPYLSFPGNRAPQGARPLGAPLRQQAPARPQEVRVRSEVGGRIRIEMAESPMLSARLTRLESANQNVPINFVRGVAGFGM